MSLSSKLGVWILPNSKEQLLKQTRNNQLAYSLWKNEAPKSDTLNALTTLPLPIKPKAEIYRDIKVENPNKSGFPLKFKQFYGYGKSLIGFYKGGVKNVWNNQKEYRQLKTKQFKIMNQVTPKGIDTSLKISSKKLTSEMAQVIYMSRVENKTLADNESNGSVGVTKHNEQSKDNYKVDIDENLFNLSRLQYQLIRRTPDDFMKLPVFAVILAIFMECTPLLCYLFPEVTPLTCVLPSISVRLYNPKNMRTLKDLTQRELNDSNFASVALKTAFNLPIDQVKYLCKSLNLVSRYIPIPIYPESLLRGKLQKHYNYLSVDNYYLSGLNNNGNIWNLDYQELIMACLERNLISDLKKEALEFDKVKDEAKRHLLEQDNTDKLRVKLFRFIVDFPQYNVGYLCLNDLAPELDHKTFKKWHTS